MKESRYLKARQACSLDGPTAKWFLSTDWYKEGCVLKARGSRSLMRANMDGAKSSRPASGIGKCLLWMDCLFLRLFFFICQAGVPGIAILKVGRVEVRGVWSS
ncbi:hypothetical protein QCA50_018067 [Cerrena zonata]|uniref:Uncharacterized protein n=1 Tax=Cerrena zonata TaxID=2478898 RepID=A0AAW0FNR0_9APHY